jgi:hypothetical protein
MENVAIEHSGLRRYQSRRTCANRSNAFMNENVASAPLGNLPSGGGKWPTESRAMHVRNSTRYDEPASRLHD